MAIRPGPSTAARNPRARPAPDDSPQHVNRNLLIAGAILLAGVVAWWNSRPSSVAPAAEYENRAVPEPTQASAWTTRGDTAVKPASAMEATSESDSRFQDYVDDKYRMLFRDIEGAAARDLRAALLERERIVVEINTAKQSSDPALRETLPSLEARKAEVDHRVSTLLPPGELAAFESVRDSDIERFQVEDYAAGIANVAPLGESGRQSILDTKLAYRQRFRRVLEDSRLMSGSLSANERRLAYNEVSRALKEYQQNYLQEVRQYLYNDQQYALLSNYETTEYNEELAKLRGIAGLD